MTVPAKRSRFTHQHDPPAHDHPDLAEWLMDQGIDSISLNPDTVVDTWIRLAQHKKG